MAKIERFLVRIKPSGLKLVLKQGINRSWHSPMDYSMNNLNVKVTKISGNKGDEFFQDDG